MARIISREDADKQMVYAVGAAYGVNEYVVDGGKGGIALNNIANGGDGVIQTRCIVEGFKKAAGVAWVEGTTYLYFDQAAKAFTTVAQPDGLFRGKAYKDALLAAVVGDVEIIEPISDAEGKMDLITAPTNDHVVTTDAAGQAKDSGLALASVQVLTVPVAAHTVAGLTGTGVLETTGILTADVQVTTTPAADHTLAALTAAGKLETSAILTADVQVTTTPAADHTIAALTAAGKLETSAILTADVQVTTVPVAGHSLAGLTAAGKLEDTTILTSSIAGAVTMGNIFNDQMRNSTNTAQSLADTVAEIIDLEDVELAGDITYTAGTTSLATIPAGGTGLYAVYWTGTFAAGAGTYNRALIYHNGVLLFTASEAPDNANPIVVYDYEIHYFAAGDTLALWAQQDSGGDLNLTAGQLAIQRLQ